MLIFRLTNDFRCICLRWWSVKSSRTLNPTTQMQCLLQFLQLKHFLWWQLQNHKCGVQTSKFLAASSTGMDFGKFARKSNFATGPFLISLTFNKFFFSCFSKNFFVSFSAMHSIFKSVAELSVSMKKLHDLFVYTLIFSLRYTIKFSSTQI